MQEPMCGKCGKVMTPVDSRIHPELFLHDACLPDELRPQGAKGFRETLAARQEKTGSVLCVGLDPLLEKMPEHLKPPRRLDAPESFCASLFNWMRRIVDGVQADTSMFKLQRAHWEAILQGVDAMQMLISYIKAEYPDIVVFVDCKRGDIARTQEQYRVAHFDLDGADGINFNPYMGKDCMSALVDKKHLGRALVGLCYTSNPASRAMQDVALDGGAPYWEYVAVSIDRWAQELGVQENAGLVMAAAYEKDGVGYSKHLKRCRDLVSDRLWFLIPGFGTQGGLLEETIMTAYCGPGSIAINSSSDIIFASSGEDFVDAAAARARTARLKMQYFTGLVL